MEEVSLYLDIYANPKLMVTVTVNGGGEAESAQIGLPT
jgi:hypothetical protein